ncbi:MAG: 2-C-methyl-D-erythritol 2,4-cyclodiphosphate synthase [Candidatus Omnitrophica bacterium]|nr:2-C-methyl-D-erythritol 2,4-cyclodiphosphate synthase [Candidatus Omnitrophota bacterium]
MGTRIGIGYDLHRLVEGIKFLLGGVKIVSNKGSLGHSDGDVLLHAICDALFGACGLPDIGTHFPDTDIEFKDMASIELLKKAYEIISMKQDRKIVNIDTVVVCDEPKLAEHVPAMKANIAEVLKIKPEAIGIKAKTTEDTAVDTISAYAVVLLEQ